MWHGDVRPGAEAQQIGGQVIGVGEALTEEIIYDEATGVPLNFNLIDYKIPTMLDMPDIDPVLIEVGRAPASMAPAGLVKEQSPVRRGPS